MLLRVGILVGNPTRKKKERQPKPSKVSPWSNLLTTQTRCRRGDAFLSCPLKEKSHSRSICPRKGALRREQRAVGSRVDRDPSPQLSVNSLKSKIKELIIFVCTSYCSKQLSMQMCFFSGGWQVLVPTVEQPALHRQHQGSLRAWQTSLRSTPEALGTSTLPSYPSSAPLWPMGVKSIKGLTPPVTYQGSLAILQASKIRRKSSLSQPGQAVRK